MLPEDYEFYFSKERIQSYNSIEEHNQNLHLISKISIHIGVFELFLRNRMDALLKNKTNDKEWILTLMQVLDNKESAKTANNTEKNMYYDFLKIKKREYKTHAQIVSGLPFGFWVNLVKLLFPVRQQYLPPTNSTEILNVGKIDFRKYSVVNRPLYDNNLKLIFVVRLIQHIRNRAFHWENLLKITISNRGKFLSNIMAQENSNKMWILPKNIEMFLNDVLDCVDTRIRKDIVTSNRLCGD